MFLLIYVAAKKLTEELHGAVVAHRTNSSGSSVRTGVKLNFRHFCLVPLYRTRLLASYPNMHFRSYLIGNDS